ncbi:MAG: MtnX-like HAD-IB family phosphatase [Ignavibacteriales bacterium]|nr:MtnX-like HAD-IB family phosphatase [Ignavibacteriales bacterium]
MTHPLSYIVFTDFDGTIAVNDIGDAIFEQFGDVKVCLESFDAYRRGEINARECWRRGFTSMRSVTKDEFIRFALTQSTDRSFPIFVDYCRSLKIDVHVLSDGFDAYIDPILEREHLGSLPRFSNELRFNGDKTVTPLFPFTDSECPRCANCKRNHMLTRSGEEHVIVYIGDGVSDRCPVQYADIVFAKGSLVAFCESNNITFHRFETFDDVLTKFRSTVETAKPKKRRNAELARKDIFMME